MAVNSKTGPSGAPRVQAKRDETTSDDLKKIPQSLPPLPKRARRDSNPRPSA